MKKYECIFPGLYNYILAKDVGMIPYTLSDKYQTSITTYNNDEYTYMENFLKKENFTINYLENTGNEKKDVTNYLEENAENIDILQLYHLRYNMLPGYVRTYKKHNPTGKIYLKLDANNDYIDFLVKRKGIRPAIRRFLIKKVFNKIDAISIETRRNYEVLQKIIPEDKLFYLPNGIMKTDTPITDKEKIILYVGYIEKQNKSTDMLLNAISNIDLNGWKLVLVGQIKEDMQEFMDSFIRKNPELKNKIILKGYIKDKQKLSEEYAKASIYCCTSRKESFGISTLEAAYHGNYIISTNVGGSPDIIKTTQYGKIIDHKQENLEKTLQETINNWNTTRKEPTKVQEKIYRQYNWNKLCEDIIKKIEE